MKHMIQHFIHLRHQYYAPAETTGDTFTVLLTVVIFPAPSLTLYSTIYIPVKLVFTLHDATINAVRFPEILSFAVAP